MKHFSEFGSGTKDELLRFMSIDGNVDLADQLLLGELIEKCVGRLRPALVLALYDCGINVLQNLNSTNIPAETFRCIDFDAYVIPEGIQKIGGRAFSGSRTSRIEIPETVEHIETYAFAECDNITTFVLPDSVKLLGNGMFYGCRNLKEIRLSPDTAFISNDTFGRCPNLKFIMYPNSLDSFKGIAKSYTWSQEVHEDCKVFCTDYAVRARSL